MLPLSVATDMEKRPRDASAAEFTDLDKSGSWAEPDRSVTPRPSKSLGALSCSVAFPALRARITTYSSMCPRRHTT